MTSAGLLDDLGADGVRWLTLDRPARLNAFTVADYRDLRVALERCAADSATRVVVLTGSGRAFCAGADRALLDRTAADRQREQAGDEFSQLLATLGSFEKPLLAAVNGLAVGFGCTMLLYFVRPGRLRRVMSSPSWNSMISVSASRPSTVLNAAWVTPSISTLKLK